MEFYYPRDLTGDQWITVYADEEAEIYLEMTQNRETCELQVRPYQVVNLKFETNFYVPEAQEQRGEKKLAVLMSMKAE